MLWDVFCRVIDNHGDLGVCWRLAADLASRGEHVRLVVDDANALAWMAPDGAAGVEVLAWSAPPAEPGDVVVEAFGCEPPSGYVARMQRERPPTWIDLEYLSAEAYVARSHGLRSPQFAGPGAGLTKWFVYPGFEPSTGGLLREPQLLDRQRTFDAAGWLAAHGLQRHVGERVVSLFCYENAALPQLLQRLAEAPTLLLVCPGAAARQVAAARGSASSDRAASQPSELRVHMLPWLAQTDYDRLLWSCDLNFVRGEDSFVRAQWAGRPFVWQLYPQADGAHEAKLEAFLALHLHRAPDAISQTIADVFRAWNGLGPGPAGLPDLTTWQQQTRRWRDDLTLQPDLASQLLGFAREKG